MRSQPLGRCPLFTKWGHAGHGSGHPSSSLRIQWHCAQLPLSTPVLCGDEVGRLDTQHNTHYTHAHAHTRTHTHTCTHTHTRTHTHTHKHTQKTHSHKVTVLGESQSQCISSSRTVPFCLAPNDNFATRFSLLPDNVSMHSYLHVKHIKTQILNIWISQQWLRSRENHHKFRIVIHFSLLVLLRKKNVEKQSEAAFMIQIIYRAISHIYSMKKLMSTKFLSRQIQGSS
jgi:hypothetical protein